jgi:hypothetical protein
MKPSEKLQLFLENKRNDQKNGKYFDADLERHLCSLILTAEKIEEFPCSFDGFIYLVNDVSTPNDFARIKRMIEEYYPEHKDKIAPLMKEKFEKIPEKDKEWFSRYWSPDDEWQMRTR